MKWTAADVPNQAGRVAVVTGANTGIGYETAAVLARQGANVVLAVRDVDKGQQAAARMIAGNPDASVTLQQLDLTSLASVSAAAQAIKTAHPRIDLLINNAGVMMTPQATTKDGFELQLGTNHFGHFALTGLLLEHLLRVDGSRVVTISSLGHRIRAATDFGGVRADGHYDRAAAYGRSKLANLLFTYELQRRLAAKAAPTIAVAAHPGGSRTDLGRNAPTWVRIGMAVVGPVLFQSAAMGALPTLRAATDPQVCGGHYYGPTGFAEQRGYPAVVQSSGQSHDPQLQRRLWAASEESTGVTFPV